VYWDSGLSGYPQHYLGVDDLPIIVSYSITSLMLFVHLHIVWSHVWGIIDAMEPSVATVQTPWRPFPYDDRGRS
jgi:hypothetical protein